jgi:integrase
MKGLRLLSDLGFVFLKNAMYTEICKRLILAAARSVIHRADGMSVGTPLVHGNINRYVLKPICKKLGMKPATTHAWRHGRISILQQNRVPGDLIKQWVGHTSLQTTSNYTHFSEDYKQRIVSELAAKKDK